MADFSPAFNVAWDEPQPAKPDADRPKSKPKMDAFGIDEVFAGFKPSFSTDVKRQELVRPPPVPPVENLSDTIAASIFGEFCEKKFGFTPDLKKK